MKIAVVGTGIAGLGISYILSKNHQLTIYEKNSYIGGHSRTITPKINGNKVPIDTGFIVFNKKNYPNLTKLFDHLEIRYSKSNMSFGVSVNSGELEYATANLNSIFAQRSNIVNLQFWKMIKDILIFYKNAQSFKNSKITVSELINKLNLGHYFKSNFLLPMAASIWSSNTSQILNFPAHMLITFFENHGLLSVSGQPQWYSIEGGSKEYIKKITYTFKNNIHLSRSAIATRRIDNRVEIIDDAGNTDLYDQVIFACHSDQTMSIIQDANIAEQNVIGKIKYQKNKIVVHTDQSFMPQRRRCWASWVYLGQGNYKNENLSLTYWMNNLQKINTDTPIFVTVNPHKLPKVNTILDQYEFEHPLFNTESINAQKDIDKIQGVNNYWFAGAYMKYGFHEDGLQSALSIADKMGEKRIW